MEDFCPTDVVFRLNWLRCADIAPGGIKLLQEWIQEQKPKKSCSEADTKPIIEVILRGLGWDTLRGDVAREGVPELGDFHLYYKGDQEDRRIAVLIEAERLNCEPKELKGKPLRQLSDYVTKLATDPDPWILRHRLDCGGKILVYGVLTNGQLWWIYDGLKGLNDILPLAYPPALKFDLLKADDLGNLLSLLSKEQVCARVEKFLKG